MAPGAQMQRFDPRKHPMIAISAGVEATGARHLGASSVEVLYEDSTIQSRVAKVRERLVAVKAHCMCLRFEETRTHYRVIYPDGYFPQGVQVDKRLGKRAALERMLFVMERHWKESFPWT